jgi:hypothetical protein
VKTIAKVDRDPKTFSVTAEKKTATTTDPIVTAHFLLALSKPERDGKGNKAKKSKAESCAIASEHGVLCAELDIGEKEAVEGLPGERAVKKACVRKGSCLCQQRDAGTDFQPRKQTDNTYEIHLPLLCQESNGLSFGVAPCQWSVCVVEMTAKGPASLTDRSRGEGLKQTVKIHNGLETLDVDRAAVGILGLCSRTDAEVESQRSPENARPEKAGRRSFHGLLPQRKFLLSKLSHKELQAGEGFSTDWIEKNRRRS